MKVTALIILAVGCFMFAGCQSKMFDLSLVSTKNVNLNELEMSELKSSMLVSGYSIKSIVVIFPLGNPDVEDAFDDAMDKASGDVMTNVNVYWKCWYVPFIYGRFGYKVVGHVWKTNQFTKDNPVDRP